MVRLEPQILAKNGDIERAGNGQEGVVSAIVTERGVCGFVIARAKSFDCMLSNIGVSWVGRAGKAGEDGREGRDGRDGTWGRERREGSDVAD